MQSQLHHILHLDESTSSSIPFRRPNIPHTWFTHSPNTPAEISAVKLGEATIVVSDQVPISASSLSACPNLRLVAVAATGYDHVDVAACSARGILVCNVRDWSLSVPEHVFSLTLALRRQILSYRQAIAEGAWENSESYLVQLSPMPRTLAGSTMGLIGYGGLAKRVESIAEGFGMHVVVSERKGAPDVRPARHDFATVLQRSDVLVLLCPLTPETKMLIGAKELASMKSQALLINCARGGIVDEVALAAAIKAGVIAGAGVDVLSEEPPRSGNPLLEIQHLPNLILTSHVAWLSVESMQALAEEVICNIESFAAGNPRNIVTG